MKTRNAGLAGLVCITDGAARTVLARNSDTARVIVNLPIETHRALLDACRREGITVDALAALIIEGHVATEAASKVVLPDRKAALLVDVPADLHDRLLAAAEAKGMTPDAILAAAVDELLADGPEIALQRVLAHRAKEETHVVLTSEEVRVISEALESLFRGCLDNATAPDLATLVQAWKDTPADERRFKNHSDVIDCDIATEILAKLEGSR
jgi:hypothetical protein